MTPLRLVIPRKLESPNTWNGAHWTVKNRITKAWESDVYGALLEVERPRSVLAALGIRESLCHDSAKPQPRTVHVERHVPKRQFIRDEDNLRFSVKPLCDALKRLGLIYDDRREYLTLDIVQIEAAAASTVITIQ